MRVFQLEAVIETLLPEKEQQSMPREQQRTPEQRAEISYPIINRQLLSIHLVARKNFMLSASVVAVLKEDK
jgi:hypothetical protein